MTYDKHQSDIAEQLKEFERLTGTGNMINANKALVKIIKSLVALVETKPVGKLCECGPEPLSIEELKGASVNTVVTEEKVVELVIEETDSGVVETVTETVTITEKVVEEEVPVVEPEAEVAVVEEVVTETVTETVTDEVVVEEVEATESDTPKPKKPKKA